MIIITYNVYHKGISNKDNVKFNNLQKFIKNIKFDILCLQECSRFEEYICFNDMYNISMKYNISKILNKICKDNISIFFNKKYGLPNISYCGYFQDPGRPFLILIFDKFLIINLHYGHYDFNNIYIKYAVYHSEIEHGVIKNPKNIAFKNIKSLLFHFRNLNFFICGDFNTPTPNLTISENIKLSNITTFKTCSKNEKIIKSQKDTYFISDHILTNINNNTNKPIFLPNISDHIPVMFLNGQIVLY